MVDAETLEELLHTNCLPTDMQRPSARIRMDRNKSRLSEVDADLARLRLEREAISADIQRCEALLSSARRVMNILELISEVFFHCILQSSPKYLFGVSLRLSQVCQTWRRVALATPRLWAAFALQLSNTIQMNVRLSRSQSYPLSFGIELDTWHSDKLIRDSPGLAELVRHRDRWRQVSVHGALNELDAFLSPVSDTYPMLETLHLCATSIYLSLQTGFFAPNLTRLEINGHVLISDKFILPNLRELDIRDLRGSVSWDYCLSMCRRHQTLERAVFGISPRTRLAPDEDIVALPSLQELHLSVLSRQALPDASPLLTKIRAPVLNKLHIQSKNGAVMSVRRQILPFLKQSSATLTTLHLDGDDYSDMDSLVEYLDDFPHLQELSLSSERLNSDDLLTRLQKRVVKQTSTVLCAPELAVIGPLWPNPTSALMVDFILSRRSNDAGGLREVVMRYDQTADDLRSHPGISECIKNGLRISARKR